MSETNQPKFGLHTNDLLLIAELHRDFAINTVQMMIPSRDKFGYEVYWASDKPKNMGLLGFELFLHAAVTINLATPKTWVAEQSQKCLLASLKLAEEIGAKGVVIHSGSWTEGSWDEGLVRTQRRITRVLEAYKGPVKILFENTAGKGTTMGSQLPSYSSLLQALPEQVGLCIDTAHCWGAGFSPAELMPYLEQPPFKSRIGLVHFNTANPSVKKGSGMDRHSVSFQVGATPPEELKLLFHKLVQMNIPMVLERGIDRRGDTEELTEKMEAIRSDLSDMTSWAKELAVA